MSRYPGGTARPGAWPRFRWWSISNASRMACWSLGRDPATNRIAGGRMPLAKYGVRPHPLKGYRMTRYLITQIQPHQGEIMRAMLHTVEREGSSLQLHAGRIVEVSE